MTDADEGSGARDVIITDALGRRPSRPPDPEAENRAMSALADAIAAGDDVLQRLAEIVLDATRSDSAGISIVEEAEAVTPLFRWAAIAGRLASRRGGAMAFGDSPCAVVVDRDALVLMDDPARAFAGLRDVEPRIHETLLAPFHQAGRPVGTVWAIRHSSDGRYDGEDARLLLSLSRFASVGHRLSFHPEPLGGELEGDAPVPPQLDPIQRLHRLSLRLSDREERYRRIVESATDYAIFTTDVDGRIGDWLPGAEAVFGWTAEEAVGQLADITFTPEDRAADEPDAELATARRRGVAPDVRWHQRKDGSRVFIDGSVMPLRNPDGSIRGFLKIGQDVTDRRRAQEHQRMLLGELQHRVRNTLGVVRSIARRTAHNSASVEEMASHFEGRLDAFARVQAMVTRRPDGAVDLTSLIEDELLAYATREGEHLSIEGPEVSLNAKPGETVSLAMHELTTNAVKYGALASERGRVSVRWTIDGDRLHLSWEEAGSPLPVPVPVHEGFGFELLQRVVPYELRAETRIHFRPGGLTFTLSMPLEGNVRSTEPALSR